jgi:hypothetical protein
VTRQKLLCFVEFSSGRVVGAGADFLDEDESLWERNLMIVWEYSNPIETAGRKWVHPEMVDSGGTV